jgi:predicted small metal-binding protein
MKEFSCGSVVPGCDTIFQAQSDEDIILLAASHAFDDHGATDLPPTLATDVRRQIRTVSLQPVA